MKSTLLLVALVGLSSAVLGPYEYPAKLVATERIWLDYFVPFMHASTVQKYETTIQVYQTFQFDRILWNCIATYHPSALNSITKKAPTIRADASLHTTENRVLCMLHAVNYILPTLIPEAAPMSVARMQELELDPTRMSPEAAKLTGMRQDKKDLTPQIAGNFIGAETLEEMAKDGWNADGKITRFGECTANCKGYHDYSGYTPVNAPWGPLTDAKRWRPLIEESRGFAFAQQHITAHIANPMRVPPVIISQADAMSRTTEDPAYDYDAETKLVIEKVKNLDDRSKTLVGFLDNKIMIAGGLMMRLVAAYKLTIEQQVLYHQGYTGIEYDAVIVVWKEKIRHDLVRPTTRVHTMIPTMIESWAGPGKGVSQIRSTDWHPYIRVMPHAEYPSGSAGICTSIAEYFDEMMKNWYGQDSFATTWNFAAGSSNVEPGMVPVNNVTIKFDNMTHLAKVCGESRLWGGMHYTKSVPAAEQLVKGMGKAAYDWSMALLPEGPASLGLNVPTEAPSTDKRDEEGCKGGTTINLNFNPTRN